MYLRVSVTDRCSLRCVYCLPDNPGFAPNSLNSLELQRLTELVHAVVRVHKIRLTGGEPTLNDDLVDHLHHAKSIAPLVGLTTNGVLLEPLLPALRAGGLDRLNISFVRSTPPASAAARAATDSSACSRRSAPPSSWASHRSRSTRWRCPTPTTPRSRASPPSRACTCASSS